MNDVIGELKFPLFTVKRGPGRHDPALKGCCQKEGLDGRTRLVGICDGPVSPLMGLVFPEDIGIKERDHSHGENFPCLRIQYDAVTALCSGFCNGPHYGLLGPVLDVLVDGEDKIIHFRAFRCGPANIERTSEGIPHLHQGVLRPF